MKELTREMFEARAAGGGIVPVYREYLADMETPVSVLSRAVDEDVFLLESVASSETGGRYSFLGVNPYATVYEKDGTVFMQTPADGVSFLPDADILAALRRLFAERNFKADPDLPPAMREKFTHTILTESERLTHLVNDLLSLQHIEGDSYVMNFKRVNLRPVAQEAVDALAPVLDARQAHVEIVGEAPDVLGNRDRLKEVVSNLVDNASRFIEPGGHIKIELYGVKDNSVIAVKDDGTGFGDVDPKMLFERFYRTDFSRARNTGGSGLGLAIVKSIVEAHDGTVEAYNLPEGGACFLVAVPSIDPADNQ